MSRATTVCTCGLFPLVQKALRLCARVLRHWPKELRTGSRVLRYRPTSRPAWRRPRTNPHRGVHRLVPLGHDEQRPRTSVRTYIARRRQRVAAVDSCNTAPNIWRKERRTRTHTHTHAETQGRRNLTGCRGKAQRREETVLLPREGRGRGWRGGRGGEAAQVLRGKDQAERTEMERGAVQEKTRQLERANAPGAVSFCAAPVVTVLGGGRRIRGEGMG